MGVHREYVGGIWISSCFTGSFDLLYVFGDSLCDRLF